MLMQNEEKNNNNTRCECRKNKIYLGKRDILLIKKYSRKFIY